MNPDLYLFLPFQADNICFKYISSGYLKKTKIGVYKKLYINAPHIFAF